MNKIELSQLNNVVVALTLQDRKNKNKSHAGKWLGRGFKKIGKANLIEYWQKRIESNPEDLKLFKEILLSYETTNYFNMTTNPTTLKIILNDVAREDLPRALFGNYIDDRANKQYENLIKSLSSSFESLLGMPKNSLEVEIKIKPIAEEYEKPLLDSIAKKIEKEVAEQIGKVTVENTAETLGAVAPTSNTTPPLWKMVNSAIRAGVNFAESGFKTSELEIFQKRLEICKGCEFFNAKGFGNTGQCMKCGCATQAKLRMASERCPIDKWLPAV